MRQQLKCLKQDQYLALDFIILQIEAPPVSWMGLLGGGSLCCRVFNLQRHWESSLQQL